ncbi:hypothetical protein [Neisseria sp. CCUG12390]|uniref:hypothetical protein n=1 Tax=Neisseria sp. CCUG12390 TaxID=3392035 RepID=UPI003A100939
MQRLRTALILSAVSALAACAVTPEQRAERAAAQKRYEQNLQVALAAQCDKETALLMKKQFEQAEQPSAASTKEQQAFRLKYVDKVADPMFQACYKMAWQNHISQQKLREARYYYDYYDDWGWRRPFYHPFW